MTHILKINEMSNETKPTLKDLFLGIACDGEYGLTYEGFVALYQTLYSEDTSMFTDFIFEVFEDSNADSIGDTLMYYVKNFLAERLFADVTDKDILEAIREEDFYNYLGGDNDLFEEFRNNEINKCVIQIEDILGIVGQEE